jgi:NADH-quinone oxidoreductase subunit G
MSNDVIKVEVDGRVLEARKGQMIIHVTDANDIYVPRFCYHNKLSIAANCRMCLVDVEKAPKPLPACATPVMDGMKVRTRSKLALEAQKSVMEFLLINHPLDCPICDQGGECELQDLAMGYGRDVSRYNETKRVVRDKDIGPLVQTDMTRCIHCTRCVRFGEEIAGLRELGATGRGEFMEIGTYVEQAMTSELSGNVIDLCPVGALTSKPFRFSARTWEMSQHPGVAPHDGIGSNIHFHVKNGRVKRVVPAANEAINEVWISDRDRFSYEGLYSADRLTVPMIRDGSGWREVDWEVAFAAARDTLGAVLRSEPASVGGLIAPTSTLEELYLFQKLLRGAGCGNIDHRLRHLDFSDQDAAPVFPWLGQSITDLEQLNCALIIGGDPRREQPLLNHRLRKAALRGAHIMLISPAVPPYNYPLAAELRVAPRELARAIAGVCRALAELKSDPVARESWLGDVAVTDAHRRVALALAAPGRHSVMLGNLAASLPDAAALRFVAGQLAGLAGATFGYLGEFSNSAGAWLAGAVPHRGPGGRAATRSGLDAEAMARKGLRAFLLYQVEPEADCAAPDLWLAALRNAGCVVSMNSWITEAARDYAHVLLPVGVYAETDGTLVNVEGTPQSWRAVANPPGEARPGWKALRVLAGELGVGGCEYETARDIAGEATRLLAGLRPENRGAWRAIARLPAAPASLQRATTVPMNSADALVRRAEALQQTPDRADGALHVNRATAARCGVLNSPRAVIGSNGGALTLPVALDDSVGDDTVLLHGGNGKIAALGSWFGSVTVKPA